MNPMNRKERRAAQFGDPLHGTYEIEPGYHVTYVRGVAVRAVRLWYGEDDETPHVEYWEPKENWETLRAKQASRCREQA